MICLLAMALSKEELENKELRQEQVLDYEGGLILMVSKDYASPEAWELGVLLAPLTPTQPWHWHKTSCL